MKGLFLPLILFVLLIAESIATELLPNNILLELYFIPHWVLVFSVIITLYYDKEHSYAGIFYGAIFAFISELVYTDLLGVYLFAYGVSLYGVHLFKKLLHVNFLVTLLLVFYALIVCEFLIYGTYFLIGVIDLPVKEYLMERLTPTVLMNLLFFLLIFPYFSKKLTKWKEQPKR
ncbi:rod shape-determining protein MreD [Allobacillus sp. GCM10007491]|uniref:Rod shape-determining protein MreD n=1 Tax=Allobacillus saliphilus TaxID=2912308 RepID=A0A941HTM0_9BACI|nr:rod shape-determining protein MreD [Allobacillus saliphilus]MBR7553419.1 rod shape-determining protein MreD [Allobacillus saliphilus]